MTICTQGVARSTECTYDVTAWPGTEVSTKKLKFGFVEREHHFAFPIFLWSIIWYFCIS